MLLAASDAKLTDSIAHVSNLVWGLTIGFVILLILVDLWLHRNPHETSTKEAAWSTLIWTVIGIGFAGVVYAQWGTTAGNEYITGYMLERALSVDNVFVFVLILSFFAVPPALQHRAMLWGVVGALVLRAIFIAIGAALIERFEWTLVIFGLILLYTAIHLLRSGDEEVDPAKNPALKLIRKVMPITHDYHGNKLFTKENGKRVATPMLAVLAVIGTTDLVFAVDSIPAVFAVTREPYLVFAANAFAVLGLRAMAALLAGIMDRFIYLKLGLAIVLGFVGLKMIVEFWGVHIDTLLSLGVILVVLIAAIGASLLRTRGGQHMPHHEHKVSSEFGGSDEPKH